MSHASTPEAIAVDRRFMDVALALGARGLGNAWPNPAVGAVVVRDDVIVGRGWTQPRGRPHAETEALRRAGSAARGATLYATLEPCSHHGKTAPCADAIIAAGIARVVSAMEDPNRAVAGKGHMRLRAAGIAVSVGPGVVEARRAHAGHILRMREGRPLATLKLAMSADGKVGLRGAHDARRPVAITGEDANRRVHAMRATHDAILIGVGTALADDPQLTCRLPGLERRSPVRIVLDRRLRLPLTGRLVTTARTVPVWVITGETSSPAAETALREQGVEVIRLPDELDLNVALAALSQRGITRLMVEGGPRIAASFMRANLVDEAVLFQSQRDLGVEGLDALEGLPLAALTASKRLDLADTENLGADTVATYLRV